MAKLKECGAGSELQLSAFRAAVHTCDDPAALRDWMGRLPDGIDMDLDLRWRLLTRLATLGATDRAELDAALADEPTGQSRVEHTRAVASLPTPEGKAFAWERFDGTVDVPNYELEAAGRGMWRGGQDAVTREYVERYFAELPRTVEVRSGWVLADAARDFFPRLSVDRATVERAHRLAGEESLDLSLRRALVDSTDDIERALRVRESFWV
jgi:aminopeptidase N